MRISDWSSDVCSSDLVDLIYSQISSIVRKARKSGVGMALAEHETNPFSLKVEFHVSRHLCFSHRPRRFIPARPRRAAGRTGRQIGRAPCRDSGCQYGQVSGVAVSLKKKRKLTY